MDEETQRLMTALHLHLSSLPTAKAAKISHLTVVFTDRLRSRFASKLAIKNLSRR